MAAVVIELREEVRKRDDLIVDMDGQIKRLQGTIETMQEQMSDLLRRLYGRKSEKLDINQLLMDGVILSADAAEPKEQAIAESDVPVRPRGKRKHPGRRPLPEHLPRNEIIIPVPEKEKFCPETGEPRPFMGYEQTEKLEYISETLRVNVYKREKYGSPMGAEENGVVTAPVPPAVLDRCLADTGMLAHVAVSKFDDHLPLYRQERMLLRQGVEISRKTMAGWMAGVGAGSSGLLTRPAFPTTLSTSGMAVTAISNSRRFLVFSCIPEWGMAVGMSKKEPSSNEGINSSLVFWKAKKP